MPDLVSTRDYERQPVAYRQALQEGLAPDGGLYVPTNLDQLTTEDLQALSGKSYIDIFTAIKSCLASDIPTDVIRDIAEKSYSTENFPHAVNSVVTPVDAIGKNLYIQQLAYGPTGAFKDMALLPLALELDWTLEQTGEFLDALGATSGDTGSSAENGFKGLGRLSLFMLSPQNGMTPFQKGQMGQLSGGNIFNLSLKDGDFDMCQDLVKAIKKTPGFTDLGAVNSINWSRISSQTAYYVAGYLQVAQTIGEPVDFVVPSGNFGNILAGYYARKMGLPIRRLIAATNENNFVDVMIREGVYEQQKSQVTSSPSMDISKASNTERLVFELFDGDPMKTSTFMSDFAARGSVAFADYGIDSDVLLNMGFDSGVSTHQDRITTIGNVYRDTNIIIDPHTADAVAAAERKRDPDVKTICMSTAIKDKFEATTHEALGFTAAREERFATVPTNDEGFVVIERENAKEDIQHFIAKARLAMRG